MSKMTRDQEDRAARDAAIEVVRAAGARFKTLAKEGTTEEALAALDDLVRARNLADILMWGDK